MDIPGSLPPLVESALDEGLLTDLAEAVAGVLEHWSVPLAGEGSRAAVLALLFLAGKTAPENLSEEDLDTLWLFFEASAANDAEEANAAAAEFLVLCPGATRIRACVGTSKSPATP